jgi:hypothetical protein
MAMLAVTMRCCRELAVGLVSSKNNPFLIQIEQNSTTIHSGYGGELSMSTAAMLRIVERKSSTPGDLQRICSVLGIDRRNARTLAESLPFSCGDTTAGTENELQTAIVGNAESVDLPLRIKESGYFKNLLRRTTSGDVSPKVLTAIMEYLQCNADEVWENSWVRFSRDRLNPYAGRVFDRDLLADKKRVRGPRRKDCFRFFEETEAGVMVRIPVSYLLKLALADAVGDAGTDPTVQATGAQLLECFSNDNTSPETVSFYTIPLTENFGRARGVAAETSKRFLLCQFLTAYANQKLGLTASGQHTIVYFAPHAPFRQRQLNNLIPDSFYRELFMSPCLSGWSCGEAKYQYMVLCHQVLSRSQLNAIRKLKEASIIVNNLVVLPNTSNVSLANNGTHLSLGSRKLSRVLQDGGSGFGAQDEKYLGDLVIKIVEHFLPLFVGTFSAAPYRLDFSDFHPEKVLGFLPHELDYTHLRMIWRRWRTKARIKVFGHSMTPFGPEWLDRCISSIFRLKGDFVTDFRLIDYFVSVMSTDENPSLNGEVDSESRLKEDLATMGIFDTAMPIYLLYRQRRCAAMGFSGFEGRHYSLFESLGADIEQAAQLQNLVTALAYQYILTGAVAHHDIPDNPSVESERRQVFFGTAIGIPTFYVRHDTTNHFMKRILQRAARIRASRRYPGYLRVYNVEYRKALLNMVEEDAAGLLDVLDCRNTLSELRYRIADTDGVSAATRLTGGILSRAGVAELWQLTADEFNTAAAGYYRETLRKRHMEEGFEFLVEDLRQLDSWNSWRHGDFNKPLWDTLNGQNAVDFVTSARQDVLSDCASLETLKKLIHLSLIGILRDVRRSREALA